jgi:hypothetical protein
MKKILVSIVVALSFSAMAKSHGPAGCGLGAHLFEGKEGLVFNVLAATFNGSSGNQTFGMSTGTLGCEDAKTVKVSAVGFVEANMAALKNDVARGEGEALSTYLNLVEGKSASVANLQANYVSIFSKNSAQDVHNALLSYL